MCNFGVFFTLLNGRSDLTWHSLLFTENDVDRHLDSCNNDDASIEIWHRGYHVGIWFVCVELIWGDQLSLFRHFFFRFGEKLSSFGSRT